jgi:hypothetical protein
MATAIAPLTQASLDDGPLDVVVFWRSQLHSWCGWQQAIDALDLSEHSATSDSSLVEDCLLRIYSAATRFWRWWLEAPLPAICQVLLRA